MEADIERALIGYNRRLPEAVPLDGLWVAISSLALFSMEAAGPAVAIGKTLVVTLGHGFLHNAIATRKK